MQAGHKRLAESRQARGAAKVGELVDVADVENCAGREHLHLLAHMRVDGAHLHVEAEPVDRAREVEAVLERLDGARRGAARGGERALRVLDREAQLRLRAPVLRLGRGRDGQRRLRLLRELLREEPDEAVVDRVAADGVVRERRERVREALAHGEQRELEAGRAEVHDELRARPDLGVLAAHVERDFRLDVLTRVPPAPASVAERTGLR